MEKKRPHYPLGRFLTAFASVHTLNVTGSALKGAQLLGISKQQIVDVIQTVEHSHFFKSMTSHSDPRLWQDVYYVAYRKLDIYLKFTLEHDGSELLISFKENLP